MKFLIHIAFEFASWLSPEFKLYLITEFQRLKVNEQKEFEWIAKRELAKVNYRIHTDAIKENIVPNLSEKQLAFVYANEADVLNMALFGKTAKDWRTENPDKKGNIRDYATIEQLLVERDRYHSYMQLFYKLRCRIIRFVACFIYIWINTNYKNYLYN